jgi:hypothetical protein
VNKDDDLDAVARAHHLPEPSSVIDYSDTAVLPGTANIDPTNPELSSAPPDISTNRSV